MDHIIKRLRTINLSHVDAMTPILDAADYIEVLEARIAKVREETLRETLDAARGYRYRRGEAVENSHPRPHRKGKPRRLRLRRGPSRMGYATCVRQARPSSPLDVLTRQHKQECRSTWI